MRSVDLSIAILTLLLIMGVSGCEISTTIWTDECQVKIVNRTEHSITILWDDDEYLLDSGETVTLSFVSIGLHVIEIKTGSSHDERVRSKVYKVNVDSDFELIVEDGGLVIIN